MGHQTVSLSFAGRRIAELELRIALAQLMRKYRVDYLDESPMGYVQNIDLKPDRQLDIAFLA